MPVVAVGLLHSKFVLDCHAIKRNFHVLSGMWDTDRNNYSFGKKKSWCCTMSAFSSCHCLDPFSYLKKTVTCIWGKFMTPCLFIYVAQKCKSWQQLQPLYFVEFLKASEFKRKHSLQSAISTMEEIKWCNRISLHCTGNTK